MGFETITNNEREENVEARKDLERGDSVDLQVDQASVEKIQLGKLGPKVAELDKILEEHARGNDIPPHQQLELDNLASEFRSVWADAEDGSNIKEAALNAMKRANKLREELN